MIRSKYHVSVQAFGSALTAVGFVLGHSHSHDHESGSRLSVSLPSLFVPLSHRLTILRSIAHPYQAHAILAKVIAVQLILVGSPGAFERL